MSSDLAAYADKHITTTKKRMEGKGVGFKTDFFNEYFK